MTDVRGCNNGPLIWAPVYAAMVPKLDFIMWMLMRCTLGAPKNTPTDEEALDVHGASSLENQAPFGLFTTPAATAPSTEPAAAEVGPTMERILSQSHQSHAIVGTT